jgi:DtxR family Mn-dependent transcriptional regulator
MLSGKRRPAAVLSPSHEHYLRALWDVRSRQGYARLTDVARELGISHATLSVGLRPLETKRLVAHDEHRFLTLTPRGERLAREVHHRHAVLLRFLRDVLGLGRKAAERDACLLEHDVGSETTERLVDLVRLLHDDPALSSAFREGLAGYHRACSPGEECTTCGLACLTPASAA